MTASSHWLSRLFGIEARRAKNRPSRRSLLALEALETRLTPAVRLLYGGAGTALSLTEATAGNDTVTVSEASTGFLFIDLGTNTFSPSSSLAPGVFYQGTSPATSNVALVHIGVANAVSTLSIDLGAGSDSLALGMLNAAGGVRDVTVTDPAGTDTLIDLGSINLPGTLNVRGGPIRVNPGSALTAGGAIGLDGAGTPGRPDGLEIDSATLDAGSFVVLAGRGTIANVGGPARGIYIHGDSDVQGTFTILRGIGGMGSTSSHGVQVSGTATRVTSHGGSNDQVDIQARAGGAAGSGNNHGVRVENGARIAAGNAGPTTVFGLGASTAGSLNYGVSVSGGATITSNGGAVQVTGTGGGSGASAGNAGVRLDFGGTVSAGGAGSVTVTGTGGTSGGGNNHGISTLVAGQITSAGGAVVVTGTGGGDGTASSFNHGVSLLEGLVTGGSAGGVSITGTGGGGAFGFNFGVLVDGAVLPAGSAPVTVQGVGGASAGPANYGVNVRNAGGQISSSGGNVTVLGTGGGTAGSSFNHGVFAENGGVIASAGVVTTGGVTVAGTGGVGNFSTGVSVTGGGSAISSNGGPVEVVGRGEGAASAAANQYGVWLNSGGAITSGGFAGPVSVSGSGGSGGGGSNFGVLVEPGSTVTSGGGSVTVHGDGGRSAGPSNHGVHVRGVGGRITSGGDAVAVVGTGGGTSASSSNHGVVASDGGLITSGASAPVTVVGTAGQGGPADGIRVENATLSPDGFGRITLAGTGTLSSASAGVRVTAGGRITGSRGDASKNLALGFSSVIHVDLSPDRAAASGYEFLHVEGTVDLGGAAIEGTVADLLPADTAFTLLSNDGTTDPNGTLSPAGPILIAGVPFAVDYAARDGNDVSLSSLDWLRLSYGGAGTDLSLTEVGGGDNGVVVSEVSPGVLRIQLDAGTEFAIDSSLDAGLSYENPFSPHTSHYVDVDVSVAGAVATLGIDLGCGSDTLALGFADAAGGVGHVSVLDSAGSDTLIELNDLTLRGGTLNVSGGPVLVAPGATVATHGGDLTLAGTGTDSRRVGVEVNAATLDAGAGRLRVTGTGAADGDGTHGVFLHSGAAALGFSVDVTGSAGDGFGDVRTGVFVQGVGSRIAASGGAVSVTGTGGVTLLDGAAVTAAGTGDVTVTGTGAALGNGGAFGVAVFGPGSRIAAEGGAVSVTGRAPGDDEGDVGVLVSQGGVVTAGGAGGVTVVGDADAAGNAVAKHGVQVGPGSRITASGGAVRVTGTGGGSGSGVRVEDGGAVTADVVAILGTSGTGGAASAHGVAVLGADSRIAANGSATVTGHSRGTGSLGGHHGVLLDRGAVTADDVSVTGTAGAGGGDNNHGVHVVNAARVASVAGTVAVTGSGGGSGLASFNHGVAVETGGVVSGGTGGVHVSGTGGVSTGSTSIGVFVRDAGSLITSDGGDVHVTGNGGAGLVTAGVFVVSGGVVTAGGTGGVSVTGTGGTTPAEQEHGVVVAGPGAMITSAGGDVRVSGTGDRPDVERSYGVVVSGGGLVSSGGTGDVSIEGSGSRHASGESHGVGVQFDGVVSSGGKLTLSGTASPAGIGVRIIGGGRVTAAGGDAGKALSLAPGSALVVDLGADRALDAGHRFVQVEGGVDLGGATLRGTRGPVAVGTRFLLLDNDGTDDGGSFAEGDTVVIDGQAFAIGYAAGDGNDVVLTARPAAGVTVTPTAGLATSEGGFAATFSVVLDSQPLADVVVTFASSDATEGSVSGSITFTPANWDVAQTVTVTGVDDDVDDGDVVYTIVTAVQSADSLYAAVDPADVRVTNIDDDTAGVILLPTSGLVTTEAGGTAAFGVVLTSRPTADVTVTFASSDATEGSVPASVTFTPADWDVARTVVLTGVDDGADDGDVAYAIVTAAQSADSLYAAVDPADVQVTNRDDDLTAALLGAPAASPEGVAISLTSAVSDVGPAASFSYDWRVTKDGTPFAAGNSAAFSFTPDDDGSYAVTLTVTGGGARGSAQAVISVTNVAPSASIQAPAAADVGQPISFTLTAADVPGDGPFTYAIDFDGDDVIDRTVIGGNSVTVAHAFGTAGTYEVGVTVTDKDGAVSDLATHVVRVETTGGGAGTVEQVGGKLLIRGTDADDVITIRRHRHTDALVVRINGTGFGPFSGVTHLHAEGLAGDDRILVVGNLAVAATLDGGAGDDRLKGGAGDDVLRGGAGHDVLHGGAGDDVLVGGDGNDVLVGHAGRDLLVGGFGADRLTGNADEDVLVAGRPTFEDQDAALAAVMAEWTSGRSYAARVANLRGVGGGPRLNGDVFLTVDGPGATAIDDGVVDVLTGNSGTDWFFANFDRGVRDCVTDATGGERRDDLDAPV